VVVAAVTAAMLVAPVMLAAPAMLASLPINAFSTTPSPPPAMREPVVVEVDPVVAVTCTADPAIRKSHSIVTGTALRAR
jgi:hypothetical protein